MYPDITYFPEVNLLRCIFEPYEDYSAQKVNDYVYHLKDVDEDTLVGIYVLYFMHLYETNDPILAQIKELVDIQKLVNECQKYK